MNFFFPCDWGIFPLGGLRPRTLRHYFRTCFARTDKIRTMHKNQKFGRIYVTVCYKIVYDTRDLSSPICTAHLSHTYRNVLLNLKIEKFIVH